MIRVIDYQKIDLNDEEFVYYQQLVKQFGVDEFKGLFTTDSKGIITSITPTKPVSWLIIYFIQNVMINQHLRENDARMEAIEARLRQVETDIKRRVLT